MAMLVASLSFIVLAPFPPGAAVPSMGRVEGEAGAFGPCPEEGFAVKPLAGASGGLVLFYAFDGCRASYRSPLVVAGLGLITSVRFTTTGNLGNDVCGSWQIIDDGVLVAESLEACGENLEWHQAAFVPPAAVDGVFAVVWRTGLGTPPFANGLLDYLSVLQA